MAACGGCADFDFQPQALCWEITCAVNLVLANSISASLYEETQCISKIYSDFAMLNFLKGFLCIWACNNVAQPEPESHLVVEDQAT